MRIHSHSPVTCWTGGQNFLNRASIVIEELFGPIGTEPVLEHFEMLGIRFAIGSGNLVGAKGAFDRRAIDCLRPCPALWTAQDDHGPAWTLVGFALPGIRLDFANTFIRPIEGCCHSRVEVRPGDDARFVSKASIK